jgi:hypothetical protein
MKKFGLFCALNLMFMAIVFALFTRFNRWIYWNFGILNNDLKHEHLFNQMATRWMVII